MPTTNTKGAPKSCSCRMCRYGKGSPAGKQAMHKDQRAYRHHCNAQLTQLKSQPISQDQDSFEALDPPPASPKGGYYD